MIRLPILSVDADVVLALDRAHWVRLLTHRHLAGVSPRQRDDFDDVVARPDLAPGLRPKRSPVSIVGFADVTSHEQTTRKWFEKLRNEPWPETADSNVLDTGRCRRGLRSAASEDDQKVAPPLVDVKHFRCGRR